VDCSISKLSKIADLMLLSRSAPVEEVLASCRLAVSDGGVGGIYAATAVNLAQDARSRGRTVSEPEQPSFANSHVRDVGARKDEQEGLVPQKKSFTGKSQKMEILRLCK
jgi:hypothetical protein